VSDDISSEDTREGVRRRSVVRIGATAAWAVPAVALAAPASAASCSGGSISLSAVTVGDHQQSGHPKLTVTQEIQVCNTGTSTTCDLAATATVSGASTKLNGLSVSGWPAASTGGGGARSLTVVGPADGQLAPGECATYTVSYKLHDASSKHTTTIHFFTGNAGTASVSVTTSR
jgi:hypothetical protein